MNELEIKNLWQTTNDQLEVSIELNKRNKEEIGRLKIYNIVSTMKPIKIFTLLLGFLWVFIGANALGSIFLYSFSEANKFFLFSATAQVILTAIALIFYIYQLTKIFQVEIYDSILQTQTKLAQLKVSTLWVTRILFLQLPLWTTFWWNESMITDWSIWQWLITLFFTTSFTILALWLFFNIKYENRNKKWFILLFAGKEWTPLMKSIELLDQMEEYEEKDKP
jgi:hypothetical protein